MQVAAEADPFSVATLAHRKVQESMTMAPAQQYMKQHRLPFAVSMDEVGVRSQQLVDYLRGSHLWVPHQARCMRLHHIRFHDVQHSCEGSRPIDV